MRERNRSLPWPQNAYPEMEPLPELSVLLQYFRMPANIAFLERWTNCPGVELLVNVDSRTPADMQWINTSATAILFSKNIHEARAYNRLSHLARAPLGASSRHRKQASCAPLSERRCRSPMPASRIRAG